MQIRAADTKLTSGFQCYLVFSVFAMLGFWTSMAIGTYVAIIHGNRARNDYVPFFIGGTVLWIIYLISSCLTNASKYLRNMVVLPRVFQNISNAIKSAPTVNFHMHCWHHETEVIVSTDSEGNTTSRTETRQVTTHVADERWPVFKWSDQSPPASTLHYVDVLKLTRLRTHKLYSFMPTAAMRKSRD